MTLILQISISSPLKPTPLSAFLVCCVLASSAVVEAETVLPASLAYDRTLLRDAVRFGALELAFPKACVALPDSLRQVIEEQANQANQHGFQYEIEHFCGFAAGHALVFSRIVNQEPSDNFAYLVRYEPVERRSEDDFLQVRSMYSGAVALREYSFVRSGFIVRQVFVQAPKTVYQLDVFIQKAWTDVMIKTYESVLSSIYIIP